SEKIGYAILQPRRQGEEVVGITALVVDMTHQRRLEQELQRAQRLELIGRLSSGIAHDFNSLLTVILTLAELTETNLPADSPAPRGGPDRKRIVRAGERAANRAGQLLAFSRQRRVPPRRVEPNQVARRTLELLRPTLKSGIELESSLCDEELHVQADETQLQQ